MAYDAFISAWNAGAPPQGVTGAALTGTTADKLAAINAWTVPTARKDVSVSKARSILMTSGSWGPIVLAAGKDAVPDDVRALCITVRDAMTTLESIETSDDAIYASVVAMVDGLLGAGLIAQATHDALMGLTAGEEPWVTAAAGAGLSSLVNENDLDAAGGLV